MGGWGPCRWWGRRPTAWLWSWFREGGDECHGQAMVHMLTHLLLQPAVAAASSSVSARCVWSRPGSSCSSERELGGWREYQSKARGVDLALIRKQGKPAENPAPGNSHGARCDTHVLTSRADITSGACSVVGLTLPTQRTHPTRPRLVPAGHTACGSRCTGSVRTGTRGAMDDEGMGVAA